MRVAPVLLAAVLIIGSAAPASAAASGCGPSDPSLPLWARARHMTVIHDSVLLSGAAALRRGFPCWDVTLIGRPALMLAQAEREIRASGRRVAKLVVIGLGYNSLWERGRRNHAAWAARFDSEASRLIRTLRRAGAEQFVWVSLRRVNRETTPPASWRDLHLYSWYFPSVNAELRAIDRQRRRVVLADWARVGARPDVTYDSIHLNARGGRLMQREIERALYVEAHRQAGRAPGDRRPGPVREPQDRNPPPAARRGAPAAGPGRLRGAAGRRPAGLARPRGRRPRLPAAQRRGRRSWPTASAPARCPGSSLLGVGANGGIDRGRAAPRAAAWSAATGASRSSRRDHGHRGGRSDARLPRRAPDPHDPHRLGGLGALARATAATASTSATRARPSWPATSATAVRPTRRRGPASASRAGPRRAKDCGMVHPGGRNRQVFVIRGRDRARAPSARGWRGTRRPLGRSRLFRWFDWRFLGSRRGRTSRRGATAR